MIVINGVLPIARVSGLHKGEERGGKGAEGKKRKMALLSFPFLFSFPFLLTFEKPDTRSMNVNLN